MKAGVNAQVVEAFDINDKANDVYELNFGHRPYQVFFFFLFQLLKFLVISGYEQRWIFSQYQFSKFCV